jgi:pilus assembly protein CpaE
MDVPTLKNVRLSMHTLDLLSFPHDRIRLLLNRATDKVGMKQRDVESALERKVSHTLPHDRAVKLAVNRGTPVVLAEANADFSRALRDLAKALTPAEPKRSSKQSVPTIAAA